MESKEEHMVRVPKKLHAVWVGGILRQPGKENLAKWRKSNKDYEINLWIDSSTYQNGDTEQQKEYEELKKWAELNKVIINDIDSDTKDSDPMIIRRADVKNNMKSQKFYRNELTEPGANYAAAADILRVDILQSEGGVYIDAEDVYPGTEPLGDLTVNPKKGGILVRQWSNLINNDFIVSIPNGQLISKLRDVIHINYEELYSGHKRELEAHRDQDYESFRVEYGRQQSTMRISGPGALLSALQQANLGTTSGAVPEIKINLNKFNTPQKQALSWYDSDVGTKFDKVENNFRHNVKEYFHLITDYSQNSDPDIKNLLTKFKNQLDSFPPSIPLTEVLQSMKETFTTAEIGNLNKHVDNLFEKFTTYTSSTEDFLQKCKINGLKSSALSGLMKRFERCRPFDEDDAEIDLESPREGSYIHFITKIFPKGYDFTINYEYEDYLKISPLKNDENFEKTEANNLQNRSAVPLDSKPEQPESLTVKTVDIVQETLPLNEQPESEAEKIVTVNIDYPYAKEGKGRAHMKPVSYKGELAEYTGDELKRNILKMFKERIEQCQTITALNSEIKDIMSSEEFKVINTPQKMESLIFDLKTSAMESLENMVREASNQIINYDPDNPNNKAELIMFEDKNEPDHQSTISLGK